jgi:hypothetical protein
MSTGTLVGTNIVSTNSTITNISSQIGQSLYLNASNNAIFFQVTGTIYGFYNTISFAPQLDNTISLGGSGNRFTTLNLSSSITSGSHLISNGSLIAASNSHTLGNLYTTGGNVGINTSSPSAQLDVISTNTYANLYLGNNVQNRKLVLWNGTTNDHQFFGLGVNNGIFRFQIDQNSANYDFYVGAGATTSNLLMRIAGTGNVGIGTSSPSYTLDVNGTGRFNNSVYISSGSLRSPSTWVGPLVANESTTITTGGNTGYGAYGLWQTSSYNVSLVCPTYISGADVGIGTLGTDSTYTRAITVSRFGDVYIGPNGTGSAYIWDRFGGLATTTINVSNLISTSTSTGTLIASSAIKGLFNSNTLGNLFTTGGNVGIGTTTTFTATSGLTIKGDSGPGGWATDTSMGQLIITGATDTNKRIGMMIDTTNNVGLIQASYYGTGQYPLCLNAGANQGQVGINTTSCSHTLNVNGSTLFIGSNTANIKVNNTGAIPATSAIMQVTGVPGVRCAIGTYHNSTASQNHIEFCNGNGFVGAIQTINSSTVYSTSSDYRLKENIMNYSSGLDIINKLNPVSYNFKTDKYSTIGFIAHEIQEHVPEVVGGEKDQTNEDGSIKPQTVDYGRLTPYLASAIQQLNKILTNHERIIAEQQKTIDNFVLKLSQQ